MAHSGYECLWSRKCGFRRRKGLVWLLMVGNTLGWCISLRWMFRGHSIWSRRHCHLWKYELFWKYMNGGDKGLTSNIHWCSICDNVLETNHTCDTSTWDWSVILIERTSSSRTYKEPRANINPSANFFFKFSCKALSSITGRNIMIKSWRMLRPAAEYTKPREWMHVPFIEVSQYESTGVHWKEIARQLATVWAIIQAIVIWTARRKLLLRNILR